MHDSDVRPIRKGRIDKPVEFGYTAQVTDNDDGIILDCDVAPDGPQTAPAGGRIHPRTGRVPHTVTADRGYGPPGPRSQPGPFSGRSSRVPRRD